MCLWTVKERNLQSVTKLFVKTKVDLKKQEMITQVKKDYLIWDKSFPGINKRSL